MLDALPHSDLLGTIALYAIFALLVVVPTIQHASVIPERLGNLRNGIKGIAATPLIIIVLFASFAGAITLANHFPILHWGWLGENIIVAPITPDNPSQTAASNSSPSLSSLLSFLLLPIMLLAMLIFNYIEEQFYRDSYKQVAIWAALHLIMGIPLFAVLPIFVVGLIYKQIYDRYGLDTAYAAHFATNAVILSLLILSILALYL